MSTETTTGTLESIATSFATVPGGLLPALHEIQSQHGYVPSEATAILAGAFNLSIAEVHGVITFYKDFRTTLPRGPVIGICRAEACQARGAAALVAHAHQRAEQGLEIDEIFCYGNCALGPSVMAGGQLYGRVTPARFDAIVATVTK